MPTYQPPANLEDFNKSSQHRQELYDNWHQKIRCDFRGSSQGGNAIASYPAFFEPIKPPAGVDASPATPSWSGFPGAARRLYTGSLATVAARVDAPVQHGEADPLLEQPAPFLETASHAPFPDAWYRPQDEYLEWAVRRDGNTLTEILFTCEGPEYWSEMAEVDFDLVVRLYRELTGDTSLTRQQLSFSTDVMQVVRRGGGLRIREQFVAGQYNPYNRWNRDFAIHLTQRANTLGAEIHLAKEASRLWGGPGDRTDPRLICCAGYGEPNRNSDPAIGAAVNAAVRDLGKRVSLADPVGLYIRDWRWDQITCDGKPFPDAHRLFEPVRGDPASQRVLRLRFRVPPGLTFDGAPVTLSRLRLGAEPITTGGQVASLINVHLFALTAPAAPVQQPQPCSGKPCFARGHPQYVVPISPQDSCPPTGIDLGLGTPAELLADVGSAAEGQVSLASLQPEGPRTRARRW